MNWHVVDYEFDKLGKIYLRLGNGPQQIAIMADVEVGHRRAVLRGLRHLMQWAKEQFDVDELRIEGATRTSGASPGRLPRPLVV